MSYAMFPPEINSALLATGAGSGPMLAAATAWGELAGELSSAAASFASVTSNLACGAWQGAAATKMTEAAAPYAAWLATAASHSEGAACQAGAVAAAFEAAIAGAVSPVIIEANRAITRALANTNIFGFNIPAIMAMEAEYEEMWAHDVAVMLGYHLGVSQAWSQLFPIQQLLKGLPRIPTLPCGNPPPTTTPPPVTPPPPTTPPPPPPTTPPPPVTPPPTTTPP
ncbi:PPE family protein, partial [Mycobacterium pseudokansasii]|uniref:PPE family protein n=1 Tax=Mycobacterium pseudokansasii TaxID=2341080 RepID=UPI0010A95862